MWNGSDVFNLSNAKTYRVQRSNCRLTARARSLYPHFKILNAVVLGRGAGPLRSDLGREWGALSGTSESAAACGSPGKRVTLSISDRNDSVVKGRMDVRHAIKYLAFDLFL